MTQRPARNKRLRGILIAVLVLAVLVLVGAAVMIIPILTHSSAGGSGQEVPEGYLTETVAEGADGRTRVLSVESLDGGEVDLSQVHEGDELVVYGAGFDSQIGIYVSICKIPDTPGEKPGPCLGGIPEGAMEGKADESDAAASAFWITDDWAWRAFASKGYDDAENGAFEVHLLVPPASQEGLDCTQEACALTTRADHTASGDRVQDMQLPITFAE